MYDRSLLLFGLVGLLACGQDSAGTATDITDPTLPVGDTTTDAKPTTGDGLTGTSTAPTTTAAADDTTGAGATSPPVGPCDGPVDTLPLVRPRAMLVLDRSSGMTSLTWDHDAAPGTPEVPLWSSLHAAVDAALAAHEDELGIGAELYPTAAATLNYDETACPVDPGVTVPVAPNNRDEILAVMPAKSTKQLTGAWPVEAALSDAYEHLPSFDPDDARVAVLVLRRLPSCSADAVDNTAMFELYDDNAPKVVEDALVHHGIRTHVIALAAKDAVTGTAKDSEPDQVNPVEKLTELASKGGTQFVNAADESQLADAIDAALAALPVPNCVLPLVSPVQFADLAVVRLGGTDLPRVDDCASEPGWIVVAAAPPFTAIELCGAACEQLFEVGEVEFEVCQGAPS